ncbi:MAG: helix-turn-helix domain-containing protein [Chthoniobacter sp.]|uniref:helix-turn-helix domain-containing protein n=1 Tax=Chthoniobacter sp. TaxID=2510640 RepID=UPI0032ABA8BB
MPDQSFGDFVRETRAKVNLSLREFARQCEVSAPFMSDVELGRRFPSEDVMEKMAKLLGVSVEKLKNHDHRESVNELKRVIEDNPMLGFAFRAVVGELKRGTLSPDELAKMLKRRR